ncbi:hypothetical protein Tco_1519104, partial [Tanacetum coccineum]
MILVSRSIQPAISLSSTRRTTTTPPHHSRTPTPPPSLRQHHLHHRYPIDLAPPSPPPLFRGKGVCLAATTRARLVGLDSQGEGGVRVGLLWFTAGVIAKRGVCFDGGSHHAGLLWVAATALRACWLAVGSTTAGSV